jgi:hypothetical protein
VRNTKELETAGLAAAFLHDNQHQFVEIESVRHSPSDIEVEMQSQTVPLAANPADRRRSRRLLKFVPLVVHGAAAGEKTFWEDTFTVDISAHGALLILAAKVGVGQKLVLMNPQNWQREDARVARLGSFDGTRTQVGIEFMQAAPDFWPSGAGANLPSHYLLGT